MICLILFQLVDKRSAISRFQLQVCALDLVWMQWIIVFLQRFPAFSFWINHIIAMPNCASLSECNTLVNDGIPRFQNDTYNSLHDCSFRGTWAWFLRHGAATWSQGRGLILERHGECCAGERVWCTYHSAREVSNCQSIHVFSLLQMK